MSSEPPGCDGCGRYGPRTAVSVVSLDGRMRSALMLCGECLRSADRAWRLKWAPEQPAVISANGVDKKSQMPLRSGGG
jgi:hypothetical protein